MWFVAVVVFAVGCAAVFAGRSFSQGRAVGPRSRAVSPRLLAIVVPHSQDACEAVRGLATHRFDPLRAPKLPLDGCTMSESCRCRYQSVAERRFTIRRKGRDRRSLIRFELENPSRRWGPGRRKMDWLGWSGPNLWNLWKTERPGSGKTVQSKIPVVHDPSVTPTDSDRKDRD